MINGKLIEIALGEYNIRETVGKEHNPRVVNYFHEIGHKWVKDDETAWCSAFINWVAMKAGAVRSNKLNARSWLKIGTHIDTPKAGDVVVFWRESVSSWKGHVALFVRETSSYVYVLGGNQGNKVCIQRYPKSRVLEYRRLLDE